MKERFENMTLDQLDAIREVMCYLYPPTESIMDTCARQLWGDLEEVIFSVGYSAGLTQRFSRMILVLILGKRA